MLGVVLASAMLASFATVAVAEPPQPVPPRGTDPSAAQASTAESTPTVPIDASVVKIISPREKALVNGSALSVKVWTAAGTTGLAVRVDGTDKTRAFRRVGREYVGILSNLSAGTHEVVVTVDKGGKPYRPGSV